jgi:hypothetical protein
MCRRLASGRTSTAVLTMLRPLCRLAPAAAALLTACATMPSGPSMLVLPGSTKSFEAFRADDGVCRQFANEQIGGTTPSQAATTAASAAPSSARIGGAPPARRSPAAAAPVSAPASAAHRNRDRSGLRVRISGCSSGA